MKTELFSESKLIQKKFGFFIFLCAWELGFPAICRYAES